MDENSWKMYLKNRLKKIILRIIRKIIDMEATGDTRYL